MIYEKKSRKMDWIIMEAECKKQHKGQSFRKKMEAHYTQKQRRLDPHEYTSSCNCTLIGHTKEP